MIKAYKKLVNKLPVISSLCRRVAAQGEFPAGHYYSPIPSNEDVREALERDGYSDEFSDLDLRGNEQLILIKEFALFYQEISFPEKADEGDGRYFYDQAMFRHSDAIMLSCMIRKFKFRRIIEVGAGYSSAAILDTLDTMVDHQTEVTFIEPEPERLESRVDLEENSNATLIRSGVQTVDLKVFESLESGDLLFIDSSHVVKYGSDLQFLFFTVLPRLKEGVIVHFHDIFYPFEYPSDWLENGRYWNECYFLRAFLSGNRNWEIVLFNNYVNKVFSETIESEMPLCQKDFGGSIYLRKIG